MKKIVFILLLICVPLATFLYPSASKGVEEKKETQPSEDTQVPQEKSYSSVEERRLYSTLEKERTGLQEKIKVLADREKELKTLEQEVDRKFEQLDKKIQALKKLQQTTEELLAQKDQAELEKIKELSNIYAEELLAQKDQAELEKIKELSNIYSKMSPEKAALALSSLEDQQLAADLIANMKTKSAARILEQLNKLQVSALTTTLSTLSSE